MALFIRISLLFVLSGSVASATTFSQGSQPHSEVQNGDESAVDQFIRWLLQSPLVANAICQNMPQYESLCRSVFGDPAGRQEAFQLCGRLSFSDDTQSCYQVVKSGSFTREAVAVCSGNSFSDDIIACLRTIKDGTFQPEALIICNAISFSDERITCLRAIRGKVYQDVETAACKKHAFGDDRIACLKQLGTRLGN